MRISLLVCLCLLCAGNAFSCLWDSDTIRLEAKGIENVLNTISGRFDRYPPKYYQMRRDRILSIIDTESGNLAHYDDLAVAYDRLGDSSTAIEWMKRKRKQLDQSPDAEQEYRYLANLGTFYAHRWLKNGADFSATKDIDVASELIKQCIELNPDAHFGREEYQLIVLEWLQGTAKYYSITGAKDDDFDVPIITNDNWQMKTKIGAPASKAVEGFCGLITLGAAWESVDIFQALESSLQNDSRNHVAYLAGLRVKELREAGKKSLVSINKYPKRNTVANKAPLTSYYKELRTEAKGWRKQRTDYIEARLNRGEHPDSHPNFWADLKEATKPPKPPFELDPGKALFVFITTFIFIALSIILAFVFITRSLNKRLR